MPAEVAVPVPYCGKQEHRQAPSQDSLVEDVVITPSGANFFQALQLRGSWGGWFEEVHRLLMGMVTRRQDAEAIARGIASSSVTMTRVARQR